jgi:hypothetical protein
MTSTLAVTYAIAVDVRHTDTGALIGVAVVVPSVRYLAILAADAGSVVEPTLTAELWREIEAWAADGDARLPAKPAPMSPSIAAALLSAGDTSNVTAQRFAAIPITLTSRGELASLADRLLPNLLGARK